MNEEFEIIRKALHNISKDILEVTEKSSKCIKNKNIRREVIIESLINVLTAYSIEITNKYESEEGRGSFLDIVNNEIKESYVLYARNCKKQDK